MEAVYNDKHVSLIHCCINGCKTQSLIVPDPGFRGRHDIQHNDTQHKDTQHKDTQHKDTQHEDTQHKDTQHNGIICDTQHK
jgi:hypothetical protein